MKAASNPDKKIVIFDDCLQDSSRVENEIAPFVASVHYEVNQGKGNHVALPSPNRLTGFHGSR
jgi:hypothetical protein